MVDRNHYEREKTAALNDDWIFLEKNDEAVDILPHRRYIWHTWCLTRGDEGFYIWCPAAVIKLPCEKGQLLEFILNDKLSVLKPDGTTDATNNTTKKRLDFFRDLKKARSTASVIHPHPVLSYPGQSTVNVGECCLMSKTEGELRIVAAEGRQATIIKDGLVGFAFENTVMVEPKHANFWQTLTSLRLKVKSKKEISEKEIQELTKGFKAYYLDKPTQDDEERKYLDILGHYYLQEAERTSQWPNFLKAHALFHSCGKRDKPDAERWPKLIFDVQRKYWQSRDLKKLPSDIELSFTTLSSVLSQMLSQMRMETKDKLRETIEE